MLGSAVDERLARTFYNPTMLFVVATLVGSYTLWRLWSFTIKPILRPDEPKPLPYNIPYLGTLRDEDKLTWLTCVKVTRITL